MENERKSAGEKGSEEYYRELCHYIDWFLKLEELTDELCVVYEGDLEDINKILKMPIAITRIHQPYLGTDNPYLSVKEKKDWYLDPDKMLEEFCRDMAESSKNNGA